MANPFPMSTNYCLCSSGALLMSPCLRPVGCLGPPCLRRFLVPPACPCFPLGCLSTSPAAAVSCCCPPSVLACTAKGAGAAVVSRCCPPSVLAGNAAVPACTAMRAGAAAEPAAAVSCCCPPSGFAGVTGVRAWTAGGTCADSAPAAESAAAAPAADADAAAAGGAGWAGAPWAVISNPLRSSSKAHTNFWLHRVLPGNFSRRNSATQGAQGRPAGHPCFAL
eukprot:1160042-Pelagomonas_calceolata.AAC.11